MTSHQSLSNYVTLDSPQTITATKTILTDLQFSTTYTRGTAPSNNIYKALIDYKDSAGNRICLYDCSVHTDKSSLSALNAYNTSVASGVAIGYIGIGSRANGTVFTVAPTPPTSDNSTQIATTNWAIPRSGGPVISGNVLYRTVNTGYLGIGAGTTWHEGGLIEMFGVNYTNDTNNKGLVRLQPALSDTNYKPMCLYPSGTWTWQGTAVQLTSDQRLKQQISEIDDKLLDAWEDVHPCQFKYNDAVDQKGDNARLHTGYVVQQIDTACKSHNVDISEYGLYCHEEYPERTEEVTIENEDGTTSKETKVIEPAKEYYSLRYTETLVVECAYLRRENEKLKQLLQNHEERLKALEK